MAIYDELELKTLPKSPEIPKTPLKSRREMLIDALTPTATTVARTLSRKGMLVGMSKVAAEELCLFVAHGLRHEEASIGDYISAASNSASGKDRVLTKLREAVDFIWWNEKHHKIIFPNLWEGQHPLRPTITYGVYNLVWKEAEENPSKFGLKYPPKRFPLMVG